MNEKSPLDMFQIRWKSEQDMTVYFTIKFGKNDKYLVYYIGIIPKNQKLVDRSNTRKGAKGMIFITATAFHLISPHGKK